MLKDIPHTPFNETFCTHLEFRLTQALASSDHAELKGFWCDGVSWHSIPGAQLTKKHINDTRKIVTTAWIGSDGQDEYQMTIKFGKYALRRYAKGSVLVDCIPGPETMEWIDIRPDEKQVEVRLL